MIEAGSKKALRIYLIKWFLIITAAIYVAQQCISLLYRQLLIPFLTAYFEKQHISIAWQGDFSRYILYMIFYLLIELLPESLAYVMRSYLNTRLGNVFQLDIGLPAYTGRTAVWGKILILLVLIALLIFHVMPYFAGAIVYYKLVNVKIRELLEEEKRQKEENDRNRNLLLSDIAHDIKTPITSICGYSKALADGMVTGEKQQEYLDSIYAKSMRMSELITMLFEYVKMDSTGFHLDRQRGDLAELLRENIAMVYSDFEEKQMELDMQIPEEEIPYELDKVQLGRAVTNLLTNAIRYGKQGGKVFVELKDYRITVADDGMTIDDEFAKHIFEPFSRADQARSTKGGSGLGLSISSKIVEMHGGKLWLNTKYGRGYTKAFVIELPVKR